MIYISEYKKIPVAPVKVVSNINVFFFLVLETWSEIHYSLEFHSGSNDCQVDPGSNY